MNDTIKLNCNTALNVNQLNGKENRTETVSDHLQKLLKFSNLTIGG